MKPQVDLITMATGYCVPPGSLPNSIDSRHVVNDGPWSEQSSQGIALLHANASG